MRSGASPERIRELVGNRRGRFRRPDLYEVLFNGFGDRIDVLIADVASAGVHADATPGSRCHRDFRGSVTGQPGLTRGEREFAAERAQADLDDFFPCLDVRLGGGLMDLHNEP